MLFYFFDNNQYFILKSTIIQLIIGLLYFKIF